MAPAGEIVHVGESEKQGHQQPTFRLSAVGPALSAELSPGADLTTAETSSRRILQRMLRVLRFDASVYTNVERDPYATREAARVVAIVAVFAGLGTVLLASWRPGAILGAVLAAVLHWLLWSGLDSLICKGMFGTQASFQQHARALGFAETPQLLAFFAFVPVVGAWIVAASRLLTMLAGNQALATTLDLRRRQAIAVRLLGFGISFIAAAAVRAVLGDVPFVTAMLRP